MSNLQIVWQSVFSEKGKTSDWWDRGSWWNSFDAHKLKFKLHAMSARKGPSRSVVWSLALPPQGATPSPGWLKCLLHCTRNRTCPPSPMWYTLHPPLPFAPGTCVTGRAQLQPSLRAPKSFCLTASLQMKAAARNSWTQWHPALLQHKCWRWQEGPGRKCKWFAGIETLLWCHQRECAGPCARQTRPRAEALCTRCLQPVYKVLSLVIGACKVEKWELWKLWNNKTSGSRPPSEQCPSKAVAGWGRAAGQTMCLELWNAGLQAHTWWKSWHPNVSTANHPQSILSKLSCRAHHWGSIHTLPCKQQCVAVAESRKPWIDKPNRDNISDHMYMGSLKYTCLPCQAARDFSKVRHSSPENILWHIVFSSDCPCRKTPSISPHLSRTIWGQAVRRLKLCLRFPTWDSRNLGRSWNMTCSWELWIGGSKQGCYEYFNVSV